jgi:Alkaline phosphatase PhoX
LSQRKRTRRLGVLGGVIGLAVIAAAAAFANAITGPSSSQSPYVVRSEPGVVTKAILTVGDSVDGYKMVGIPDGLGAFDNGDGTFTVLMNHEIPDGLGALRAHGSTGAFVSKWTIDKDTLQVLHGEDLIHNITLATGTLTLFRLCSADLPPLSAFYNAATGMGYNGRLFMDGEEIAEGRGFAHALDGNSWELPVLGRFAWENSVANGATGNKTVVVGTDDTSPSGQVYVYIGNKTMAGTPVDRAGLTNGRLYGVKVPGFGTEPSTTGIPSGTPFTLVDLGSRVGTTGAELETASNVGEVTKWLRPEDGSWDPTNPNGFYFVTTNAFAAPSRLWRLNFNDMTNPTAGGTVDMVLDGTEGQKMFDNITVNDRGQVLLQEDVGSNERLGKIWQYFPDTDTLEEVAHHDPDRFAPGAPNFLTQDEESSGIIPAPFLGEGWYLADVQAHYPISGELVEGGQLFALHVPPGKK